MFLPYEKYWLTSRFLIGWDAGVALYLTLVLVMVLRSGPDRARHESPLQDEGRIAIPILTVAAGMASLGAIIVWLRTASETESLQPGVLALLFLTTLLSWLFIHTMSALYYAHEYHAEHRGKGSGLRFPGRGSPDYGISSTSPSSSAPQPRCPMWRPRPTPSAKPVTAHGVVAFVFNVTMIALTVSIAGDAISLN